MPQRPGAWGTGAAACGDYLRSDQRVDETTALYKTLVCCSVPWRHCGLVWRNAHAFRTSITAGMFLTSPEPPHPTISAINPADNEAAASTYDQSTSKEGKRVIVGASSAAGIRGLRACIPA